MNRRTILTGLVGLAAAPAVLRLGVHMPVRAELSRAWYAAMTPVGLRDGTSPHNAGRLYDMIGKARPGDHVILVGGDHRPPMSIALSRTFAIIGGYNA